MLAEQTLSFDHYQIQTDSLGNPRILSTDGTGTTYKAEDTRSGHSVIIRVFSERLLAESSVQKDFVNHARLLIELDHPNITRIIDTGQQGNQFFYVMNDPGGRTVREIVEEDGPMELSLVLRLQSELSETLIASRTQPGLLSRIWPNNVIVTTRGSEASLIIIAQNLIGPAKPEEAPAFLAPEILAGHPETPQSTLYSVGATLYYMLTGQAPQSEDRSEDELIELKTHQPVDTGLLPSGAPISLMRQVLEAQPRERPRSMMEWDRSLQRFIRFTPTSSVRTKPEAPPQEQEAALANAPTPKSQVPLAPSTASHEAPPRELLAQGEELEKAKVHTQRLSLELTKRVQKELALTEQLKRLESELEKERATVRKLSEEPAPSPKNQDSLEAQWEELRSARKELDREKKEFLKKTQRFSLNELKADAEKQPAEKSSEPLSNKTKKLTRLFHLGKLKTDESSAANPPPPTKKPEVGKSVSPKTVPSETPAPPPPTSTTQAQPLESTQRHAIPSTAASTATTRIIKPKAEDALKPKAEMAAKKEAVRAPADRQKNDSKKASETTTTNKSAATSKTAPQRKPVVGKAAPTDKTAPTKKPTPFTAAHRETASKSTPTAAPPFGKPFAEPNEAPTNKLQETKKRVDAEKPVVMEKPVKTAKPVVEAEVTAEEDYQVQPLRGAWFALAMLSLVIALGLYMVYRTFFSKDSSPLLGESGKDQDAVVLEIWPEENRNQNAAAAVPNPVETESPNIPESDPGEEQSPSREDALNDELRRIDLKVFNNYLLLEDQEWAELLHGLKLLESQPEQYSEAEITRIRADLLDDLLRKTQLHKDSGITQEQGYKDLLAYLQKVLPEGVPSSTP